MEDSPFIEVKIFGEKYKLLSNYQDREDLLKVAHLVDEKMENLYRRFPKYSKKKLAILASLNLADELFRMYKDREIAFQKINNMLKLIEHGF